MNLIKYIKQLFQNETEAKPRKKVWKIFEQSIKEFDDLYKHLAK